MRNFQSSETQRNHYFADRNASIVGTVLADSKRAGIRPNEGYTNQLLDSQKAILMIGTGRDTRDFDEQNFGAFSPTNDMYSPGSIALVIAWYFYRTKNKQLTVKIYDKSTLGFKSHHKKLSPRNQIDLISQHLVKLLPKRVSIDQAVAFRVAENQHFTQEVEKMFLGAIENTSNPEFLERLLLCIPENIKLTNKKDIRRVLDYTFFELSEIANAYQEGFRIKIGNERERLYDAIITGMILGNFGKSGQDLWEVFSSGTTLSNSQKSEIEKLSYYYLAPHPDTHQSVDVTNIKKIRNQLIVDMLNGNRVHSKKRNNKVLGECDKTAYFEFPLNHTSTSPWKVEKHPQSFRLSEIEEICGSVIGNVYWDSRKILETSQEIRHRFLSTPFHPNPQPRAGKINFQKLLKKTQEIASNTDENTVVQSCVANIVNAVRSCLDRNKDRNNKLYLTTYAIAQRVHFITHQDETAIYESIVTDPQFVIALSEYTGKEIEVSVKMICEIFSSNKDS